MTRPIPFCGMAGVALLLSLLAGCKGAPGPAGAPGAGSGAAQAVEASGAAPAATADSAVAAEGSAPAPVVGGGACEMIIDEAGTGAASCPEGCVLINGAPVLEDVGCALVGPRFEVAMGCLRPPIEAREPGACYRNAAGIHVVTALRIGGLEATGWSFCPPDSPFVSAARCTTEQLESARAPRTYRLRATGELVEEGSN